jgi:hypothetical protein
LGTTIGCQDKIKKLLQAITVTEAYRAGHASPSSRYSIQCWINQHHQLYSSLGPTVDIEKVFKEKRNKCCQKWHEKIEVQFQNHLHNLFRHVTKVIANDASIKRIVHYMIKKSKANFPHCPQRSCLHLTRNKFWSWFNSHSGQLNLPTPKP